MAVLKHSPLPRFEHGRGENYFRWIVAQAPKAREIRQFERDVWLIRRRAEQDDRD